MSIRVIQPHREGRGTVTPVWALQLLVLLSAAPITFVLGGLIRRATQHRQQRVSAVGAPVA